MYSRNRCRSRISDYILLGALLRRMLTNAVVSASVVCNCHGNQYQRDTSSLRFQNKSQINEVTCRSDVFDENLCFEITGLLYPALVMLT